MVSAKNVMIVDDSMVSRMMIRAIIEEAEPEWNVIEAKNSQEAVDKVKSLDIHIITLDMNMPGESGIEVVPKLKQEAPDAVIALLTANIQDSVRQSADELGLSFIAKPITEEKVLKFIHTR